ncbi:hypothetical protein TBR22_A05960 [Luteitalea sp. TBR-22]|uniref:DUF6361 family protein n=1 Tax=Luteitalea sp. TBR-22 TaxID=2802971 RepID=UPI001AFAE13C|nr:DUF6361 family protein [Luteitalea sp. TBR-22]BCS31395.1 hypothetical protein TBR22_A05960 [Luteitalea sp. TBR-22]
MASTFGWLDGSEQQRRQMKDLLAQFREQDTRDELGLATIRDAFADLFFPGTGTLQTRARYFFFIPWMYRELAAKRVPAASIATRVRRYELDLITPLLETGENGVIGKNSRRNLQRTPSNIYWNGLRRLGFFRLPLSQDQYHRRFDAVHGAASRVRSDDGEPVSTDVAAWHPQMPTAPATFPGDADLELTADEADFLYARVVESAPESLFAWWLVHQCPGRDEPFAWSAMSSIELPDKLRRQVEHARRFSLVVHGATILYTFLLTKLRHQQAGGAKDAEKLPAHETRMAEWHVSVTRELEDLRAWSFSDFWSCLADQHAVIGRQTRDFVEAWTRLVLSSPRPETLLASREARSLIESREQALKKKLSRFQNTRALEVWGGSTGLRAMDFRWSSAVVIGQDIQAALS